MLGGHRTDIGASGPLLAEQCRRAVPPSGDAAAHRNAGHPAPNERNSIMSKLRTTLRTARHDVRALLRDDTGAATAEYAIATMATIELLQHT